MAKDVSALREEAAAATAAGKLKRALAAYLELERIEPREAQWAKRAGETYRRLGNTKNAMEAFNRSADRYAQNGFLVQAIAVCKLVLQIDPQHADTLRRLAQMNEQVGAGPTRAAGMAENNPGLHENPNVAAIRRANTSTEAGRQLRPSPPPRSAEDSFGPIPVQRGDAPPAARMPSSAPVARTFEPLPATPVPARRGAATPEPVRVEPAGPRRARPDSVGVARSRVDPNDKSSPDVLNNPRSKNTSTPALALPRTKSKPITLPPDAAIDRLQLSKTVPLSQLRERTTPGIHVIPIDDGGDLDAVENVDDFFYEELSSSRNSAPDLAPDFAPDSTSPDIQVEPPNDEEPYEPEIEEATELELDDIEEIPLPAPRAITLAAQRTLAATPLFAGLASEALEALVEHLSLVTLDPGEDLFTEGDPGESLYVLVEGEVSVQAEGPPRVEMSRLGPGAFIGEVALMTDQPRAATVTALSSSELLCIDRATLARVLSSHGDMLRPVLRFVRDRLVDRWTRTSPLFRPFDDMQRAELAAKFKFLEFDADTRLLRAGVRPDGLYIVLAGQFVVRRDNTTIATLAAGDLIGETALLSGGAFKSDVIAQGRGLALCLPAADFREVIMTHPHVLEYIGEHAEHSRRLQIL